MIYRGVVAALDNRGAYVRCAALGVGTFGPLTWQGDAPAVGASVLVANTGTESMPDLVVLTTGGLTPQLFGAIGDGVHDDTTALQSALVAQREKGVELTIPAGVYKITAPLDMTNGGHIVQGAGSSAAKIVQHGVGVPVIRLGGYGNRLSDVGLEQDDMPTTTGDANRRGESGIEFDALYLSVVERVRIAKVTYGLVLPNDRARFCFSSTFENLDILEVYGGAISIFHHPSSGSTGNVFRNVYCNGSYLTTHDWPIKIQGLHDSSFDQLNVEGFTSGGLMLFQQAGAAIRSLHLEYNTMTDYDPSLIRLYDSANIAVESMTVQNTHFAGPGSSGVSRLVSIGTDNCTFLARGVRGLGNTNENNLPLRWVDVEPADATKVEVRMDGFTWYGSGVVPDGIGGNRGVWSIKSRPTVHHARRVMSFVSQPLTQFADTVVNLPIVSRKSGWLVDASTPNVLTVGEAGAYLVEAGANIRGLEGGETNMLITVNGSFVGQNGGIFTNRYRPSLSTVQQLAAGDVVGVSVYTESTGSPVIFEGTERDTWLSVTYLGAATP